MFEGVEMLADGGLGSTFRIGDRELFVGHSVPLQGTTVSEIGRTDS